MKGITGSLDMFIPFHFADYFVDDNQIPGTKTVLTNAPAAGNITFTVHVDGKIIKANGGGTITWKSDRTHRLWKRCL